MPITRSFIPVLLILASHCAAQETYRDSIRSYIRNYVEKHEVVTGDDKKYFSFFPLNENYKVNARFEKVKNASWFSMETSGPIKKIFRVYGIIYFIIHDTAVRLNIYQSQQFMATEEYKEHMFLPFTDLTSGENSYASGRYIDLLFGDIIANQVIIDFNKAYNPYCAYVSGKYNCPIPPKENNLPVAILAGEKNFLKKLH